MNKVISINLNGNAYQLEEQGFEALETYLREARRKLAGNPDLEEILSDLEQAIAEKCNRFLKAGKTVVLSSEVQEIIEEMGPVRDSMDEQEQSHEDTDAAGSRRRAADEDTDRGTYARGPRKLYRLKDDKMVEGVCSGIAAYLGVDPTIVRIIFVALLIISGGIVAIAYLVMALVIPLAKTPEEHAAAHGAPFDAQDIIERARSKFQDFQNKADRTQSQKTKAEYWKHHERSKGHKGLSAVLTLIAFIVGVSILLKIFYWPVSLDFTPFLGIYSHNPWISLLVFIVLIYVLGRLIKNISSSEDGSDSLLAGILKFCLVFLVIMFVIRMFPILAWMFAQIFSWIQHFFIPFHW